MKRLLELSYLYCWGKDGNADLRDEWQKLYYKFAPAGKTMSYLGNGKFSWSKVGGKNDDT